MLTPGNWWKMPVLAAALLCAAPPALADKIILKNGRQIIGFNVVDDGTRIRYETSAGQLSIPKSIVDHIEKGGLMPGMESPAAAAASLEISPPAKEETAAAVEIDHNAVHDGSIDRDYIAKAESDAKGGAAGTRERAALAHHAAAQFYVTAGDTKHAMDEERAALEYMPDNAVLLADLAYMYLRQSQFKDSLTYLEKAKLAAPKNADLYKLAGWAYYGMNRSDLAVNEWKKSLELRPDSEVRAALDKAERDRKEEEGYKENESPHFQLRYSGSSEPALAREVLRTLEAHFSDIESELNYTPPEPIAVVLYTQSAFADITRAPGWVGALNDGRIRVPVQGLTSVNSELSRILRHELTHSFIQQKTHGRAPTWMQEGIAQWIEGKRSDENAGVLVQIYDQGQSAPLDKLEGSWLSLPAEVARYAYAWALANIEYIAETQGMSDIERILGQVGSGSSTEQAVRDVLHDSYIDLMQATNDYLKKTYGK
jgi:tetratricopeptide (TPR) repeat protein